MVGVPSAPDLVAAALVTVEDRQHLDDFVSGSLDGVYRVEQAGAGGACVVDDRDGRAFSKTTGRPLYGTLSSVSLGLLADDQAGYRVPFEMAHDRDCGDDGVGPQRRPGDRLRPGLPDDRQQRLRDGVAALWIERQYAPVEVVRARPARGELELTKRESALSYRQFKYVVILQTAHLMTHLV